MMIACALLIFVLQQVKGLKTLILLIDIVITF